MLLSRPAAGAEPLALGTLFLVCRMQSVGVLSLYNDYGWCHLGFPFGRERLESRVVLGQGSCF